MHRRLVSFLGINRKNMRCLFCDRSMALGRPMPPLVLSDEEVQQLQVIANSRSYPYSLV
jgi:hypothetical protein